MHASTDTLPHRLSRRIDARNGSCWIWTGRVNRNGYGRVWLDGKEPVAHRAIYKLLIGDIPDGLVLDHLCRNRRCVNPMHLEPVTVRENTRRGGAVLFQPLAA